MGHSTHQANRAEGQRLRMIRLLEQLADADEQAQCPKCGRWYDPAGLSRHEAACDATRLEQ